MQRNRHLICVSCRARQSSCVGTLCKVCYASKQRPVVVPSVKRPVAETVVLIDGVWHRQITVDGREFLVQFDGTRSQLPVPHESEPAA